MHLSSVERQYAVVAASSIPADELLPLIGIVAIFLPKMKKETVK